MQLTDLFDLSLVGRAAAIALDYDRADGQTAALTFGELEVRSNRLARLLRLRGLERGDRLGIFLPNRVEFIDLFLACLKLGVIVVPVNVLYRERELSHILSDAEPKAVVTTRDLAAYVPSGAVIWEIDDLAAAAASQAGERIRAALDGDTPAALVYTSGTTGRSKGAILTHNNFLANTVNLLACWRISEADRYLAVLPLFHVHGLGNGVHVWLASGCRMSLKERFDINRAPAWFADFQPTLFFGVPTVYVRLLELPDDLAQRIGARTRLFVSGSAPLPAQVLEDFRAKFGHTILERYGMSETLMNISNPYGGERRPGAVGQPLPGVSVKIVNSQGHAVTDGEPGELYVRGPNVCAGYWRRPEATAEAFVDAPDGRWFKTGDLGERSADGYYTLRGRRTDLIISGGFNIYPREIEEVLLEQPGVREAVVCGVPDARRGELPVAYVVADEPFDAAALEDACRKVLASFKVPRGFIRVAALPRTALGKVQKHLLPPWTTEQ
ncbi:MAG: AMP-binding protein [Acidobacteria bacterium]|nr:AMP-binding protein [Acidobacteriota bacterium]MBI3427677.1 AMP-binding protein [Acidobacteriota bacterium]